ncbi:glycerophosphodiester phosphodiesterase [Cryobacterium sp. TMT1-21]|uniref:Glycerophosphodiester phosphodiesterase n=1 Tax=Cryobacterium shii TaxID=1259235 RepID=A0AAQ2C431_9MICO|nr:MULTISPECIES: glycerophosphodiester phosphodiesterase family protein [Cryobacterium]TFC41995.1 glycerophosphodiester phosphodiesterase [Cryobacterium shii]TFC81954.1 glycerophosphodiester phosphodiesterase [Cryobacterium sp. TmT2-59]TFD09555.1 glycerophosphodiester phosphodiesterase [Cryobacterium sp. TMT1-21]TFD18365.1 glycerophosphodiester phosphodiesterase [Cryobacterium sp. TMT2-23]TFD18427.1 glycerophosphodiester phosphodiesterase [Cryobacterium sp. TMT4-10]
MTPGATSRFLDGASPRVFAHRGLALDAPENTLLAFAHALAAGATHIETDVRATDDGIAVISHDADFVIPGTRIRVDSLTMAELHRINRGHGQSFSSLGEGLDAFPDARFNIDVKSEAAIEATAFAVRDANATGRVLITSFSEDRRRRTAALLPGVATSPSASIVASAFAAAELGLGASLRRSLHGFTAVQVPETVRFLRILTPRFIRAVHAAGVEVHVWTVNDPADMSRLLDLGIEGLVTDRCDLAAAVIADRT